MSIVTWLRKSAIRLTDASEGRRDRNNFDLLRLFGALCVVFAHSFDLLEQQEPFPHVVDITWGFVGVLIFFSISGFLVTRSFARSPRVLPFAVKRALRLIPGLFVAVLLTAFVLGPLVTTEPLSVYLRDPATKAYVLNNTIMQSDYGLPGVFAHTVYPAAVNGSLWTLPVEVKCYVFVALAGMLGLLTRWRYAIVAIAVLAVLLCINSLRASVPGANHLAAELIDVQANSTIINQVKQGLFTSYPDMFAAFAVGAALYVLRGWVTLRLDLAALALGAIVAGCLIGGQGAELTMITAGPYLVLCVAYMTPRFLHLPRRAGDYSYGMYVYAFPVQQTISYLIAPRSGWVMFLIATPITLALAAASWHLIERPALNIKARITGAEVPAGTTPAAGETRRADTALEIAAP